jgi:hypothetical protein
VVAQGGVNETQPGGGVYYHANESIGVNGSENVSAVGTSVGAGGVEATGAPPPTEGPRMLSITFNTSRVRPGVVDMVDLRAVGEALSSLLAVRDPQLRYVPARRHQSNDGVYLGEPTPTVAPVPLASASAHDAAGGVGGAGGGGVPIACDPYSGAPPVVVDLESIREGELVVFVYSYGESDVPTCSASTGTMAHAQICAYRTKTEFTPWGGASSASTRQVIHTIVAYINVCEGGIASTSSPLSTRQLRRSLYAHELLHALGFLQSVMEQSGVLRDVEGAPGLMMVASPRVVEWSRWFYGCSSMGGGYIVNGHWDPFFVGWPEVMSQRITSEHRITLPTLALLADLGAYYVEESGLPALAEAGLWVGGDMVRTRASQIGCRVAVVRCGHHPRFLPEDACIGAGVEVGQWVAAPYPQGEDPGGGGGGGGGDPDDPWVDWSDERNRKPQPNHHQHHYYVGGGYPREGWATLLVACTVLVFWMLLFCPHGG